MTRALAARPGAWEASCVRCLSPILLVLAIAGCGGAQHGSAPASGIVWRLDPRSGVIEGKVRIPGRPCRLAADAGGAWVTDISPPALYRGTRRAATFPGERPCGVAGSGASAWVGTASGRLIRIPDR